MLKKILRYGLIVVITYFIYALIVGVLPYAIPKKVSREFKNNFKITDFYSDTNSNDRIMLLEDFNQAMDERIRAIKSAQEEIIMASHSVTEGKASKYILAALLEASNRGVKIKFILDSKVGGFKKHSLYNAFINNTNVDYYEYSQINLLQPWEFNSAFHDKFLIIDNRLLILGGRNMDDRFYGLSKEVTYDREVLVYNTDLKSNKTVIKDVKNYANTLFNSKDVVKIKGNKKDSPKLKIILEEYNNYFKDKDFNSDDDYYIGKTVETNKITLINNPINNNKKEPLVAYRLQQLAYNAKAEVIVQSPYTIGNKYFKQTFKNVADKVNLKLLTNSLATSPNLPAFSYYYVHRKGLLKTGINIYEYQKNGSIHTKSMLVDDNISIVGSFNLDMRSAYIDTETMLVIDSKPFNKILKEEVNKTFDKSLKVGKNNKYITNDTLVEKKPSLLKIIATYVVSIFSTIFKFLI
ncbi:MAG: phospholipase D family protein [Bacilli bacterium]